MDTDQKLDVNVSGMRVAGPSTLWRMTGSSLDAANRVGQASQVEVKEIAIGEAHSVTVAPISISIYRFPVAESAQ